MLARLLTLVGRREQAAVQLARNVDGWFSRKEIRLLYRTVRRTPGPGDIAEVGSWKGRSTVAMGLALKHGEINDCRIYAIDHHLGSEEHLEEVRRSGSTIEAFRENIRRARIAAFVREMVMPSERAAGMLSDQGVGLRLLFLDGAHDEDSVRRDIRSFLPLLLPGGIIALHDCEPEGGRWPGVWIAYQHELAGRVEVVDRTESLLVTRLRRGGGAARAV